MGLLDIFVNRPGEEELAFMAGAKAAPHALSDASNLVAEMISKTWGIKDREVQKKVFYLVYSVGAVYVQTCMLRAGNAKIVSRASEIFINELNRGYDIHLIAAHFQSIRIDLDREFAKGNKGPVAFENILKKDVREIIEQTKTLKNEEETEKSIHFFGEMAIKLIGPIAGPVLAAGMNIRMGHK